MIPAHGKFVPFRAPVREDLSSSYIAATSSASADSMPQNPAGVPSASPIRDVLAGAARQASLMPHGHAFGGAALGDSAAVAALCWEGGAVDDAGLDVQFAVALLEAIGTDGVGMLMAPTPPPCTTTAGDEERTTSVSSTSRAATGEQRTAVCHEDTHFSSQLFWAAHCVGSLVWATPNGVPLTAFRLRQLREVVLHSDYAFGWGCGCPDPTPCEEDRHIHVLVVRELLRSGSMRLLDPVRGSCRLTLAHLVARQRNWPALVELVSHNRCLAASVPAAGLPSRLLTVAEANSVFLSTHNGSRPQPAATDTATSCLWWPDGAGFSVQHLRSPRNSDTLVPGLSALGADFAVTDLRGDTPLHLSVYNRHVAVAHAIVSAYPATMVFPNAVGDSPADLVRMSRGPHVEAFERVFA